MLKLADIRYPITFHSRGVGYFTYESENQCVMRSEDTEHVCESNSTIEHFIRCHNQHYLSVKDYAFAMPGMVCKNYTPYEGQDMTVYEGLYLSGFPIGGGKTSIQKIIGDEIHKETVGMKAPGGWRIKKDAFTVQEIVTEGAIEDMPIGASLVALKNSDGEYESVQFKVRKIEVHDDTICLLSHFGGYNDKPFAIELNIKRGTMVKWKVKV